MSMNPTSGNSGNTTSAEFWKRFPKDYSPVQYSKRTLQNLGVLKKKPLFEAKDASSARQGNDVFVPHSPSSPSLSSGLSSLSSSPPGKSKLDPKAPEFSPVGSPPERKFKFNLQAKEFSPSSSPSGSPVGFSRGLPKLPSLEELEDSMKTVVSHPDLAKLPTQEALDEWMGSPNSNDELDALLTMLGCHNLNAPEHQ